jgi:DNA invertase Pin-like site-specific DNA recombinase
MVKCRLIGYRRVSTQGQGQSGLGLEAQQSAIDAHVTQTGCSLVATYTEVESGKKSDRPELVRAMAHARRAGATLVIAKLDRLARNVHFLSGLMESGVEFLACDMPYANRLTLHIMAAVAEDEARRISQRTKDALAAVKARGVKLGGARENSVSGLNDAGRARGRERGNIRQRRDSVEVYSDLLPVVRELRDGGATLRKIAEHLNTHGHCTRTGAAWSPVQVKRLLDRV